MMRLIAFCLLLLSALAGPSAHAQLPDAQRFSVVLEMGDLAQAKKWLDAGLDPNFEGQLIGNGLMIGAWEGNIPLMELFLGRGADIHRANRHGETALMLAAWRKQRAALRWLLERGARPNRPEREWTALHYATFSGHAELVEDLLKAGADVNARSTNGSTVIMMAAREGHAGLARRLLAAGANPAIQNDFNEDAVAWAMRQGNYEIAKSFTSAENFAALARAAAQLRAPQRSIPVPDVVEEHLRMARLAATQGRDKDAVAAYRKAFAALKAQEAPKKVGAGGTAKTAQAQAAKPPSALVISAKRGKPEDQSMGFSYSGSAPSAEPATKPAEDPLDALLAQARAAEAAGRRQEALRLYRELSSRLRTAPR